MVDNEHCYGALTSGTRTYFLKIEFPERTSTSTLINEASVDRVATRSQAKRMRIGETTGTPDYSHNCESDSNGDDEIKVYISDAWFVGEANYLRAWAYVDSLRESMQEWQNQSTGSHHQQTNRHLTEKDRIPATTMRKTIQTIPMTQIKMTVIMAVVNIPLRTTWRISINCTTAQ